MTKSRVFGKRPLAETADNYKIQSPTTSPILFNTAETNLHQQQYLVPPPLHHYPLYNTTATYNNNNNNNNNNSNNYLTTPAPSTPTSPVLAAQLTMIDSHQPLSPRVTKRRRNRDTPPRPLNSFMIYRREYQKRIKEENPNILLSELSRISKSAADRWANETQQVKQHYAQRAKEEKERHMKLYPNYVYCPRRPSRAKPRKKSASNPDGSCEKMSLGYLLNNEANTFRAYNPC